MKNTPSKKHYDYVIVGSGFGGSVSALRLSEKGYKVLVIEKGRWFKQDNFAKTNWNLKKWLWLPRLGLYGIQNLAIFRHVSIINGIGVGGGSLVYANTLPKPKTPFFNNGPWAKLADWQKELEPYYNKAWEMLGAVENPYLGQSDKDFQTLSKEIGKPDAFRPTKVAVYFGEKDKTKPDPFFNGKGPDRTGCNLCGQCMTGCRHNAKNTLDKNYLHLAQQLGAEIIAEQKVYNVLPTGKADGSEGYEIFFKKSTGIFGTKQSVKAKHIIFSGGVLGTVPLLLKLKKTSLPNLSDKVGHYVLTNNEALIMNVSLDKNRDMSDGIAIGSIIDLDKNSHIEPVRYGNGSGFWRMLSLPMVSEKVWWKRMLKLIILPFTDPINWLKVFFTRDFGKQTSVILFMQHLDSTLRFTKSALGLKTEVVKGEAPSAFIPEAHEIAKKYTKIINGKPVVMSLETIMGTPSTAHILGGASMGENKETAVIDKHNKVFGYKNMHICDGSMISANPGVNPALSITAITEHAMNKIQKKQTT
ncbi:MAG: FAD-dependent oxidoreductase [Bacteroidota bacterium]|nr:FAD-dependent oxidoreductase [Bacteroidota bacterium]